MCGSAREYVDVIVSDVRTDPFSFSIQVLQDGGIPELEQLIKDFSLHHQSPSAAQTVAPRSGDLVSAKFSVDKQWYRARVLRANPSKKQAEVVFMDYGNSEVLPFDQLRPLGKPACRLLPISMHADALAMASQMLASADCRLKPRRQPSP